MKKKFKIGALMLLILLPFAGHAELTLGSLFQDHMVLQRDMPVPVGGTADSGTTVTVEFAGQKKSVVTDAANHWKVILDPLPASFTPSIMTISSQASGFKLKLSDVLNNEGIQLSGIY